MCLLDKLVEQADNGDELTFPEVLEPASRNRVKSFIGRATHLQLRTPTRVGENMLRGSNDRVVDAFFAHYTDILKNLRFVDENGHVLDEYKDNVSNVDEKGSRANNRTTVREPGCEVPGNALVGHTQKLRRASM